MIMKLKSLIINLNETSDSRWPRVESNTSDQWSNVANQRSSDLMNTIKMKNFLEPEVHNVIFVVPTV